MINSLTELEEAKEKGQQFEFFSPKADDWVGITVHIMRLFDVEQLILDKRLRVKQIKG